MIQERYIKHTNEHTRLGWMAEMSDVTDKSRTRESAEFDDVFDHVRSFGAHQRIMYFGMKSGLIFPMMGQLTALIFAMGTPQFHCATPNVTCHPQTCCENCTEYAFGGPMQTTVSEWNLICDRAYLGATLQSCHFVGMLVGSFVSGIVSDGWGRKKCIFISHAIMFIAGIASAFVDSVSFFAVLRFLVGFSMTGTMLAQYTYTMEIVGPKRRTMAGSVVGFFWNGYGAFSVLLAYFVRDWRALLLVYTAPAVLLFPCWKWIPESARWLLAHDHLDEAHAVLMKYGPKKGRDSIDSDALRALLENIKEDQLAKELHEKKHTPFHLIRTTKLRKWTMNICYHWFTVGLVNFGVYLFVSQLAGNLFVNYIVMRMITVVRIPVNWFVYGKFGRRLSHGVYTFGAGVVCLLILAVYQDFPLVTTGLAVLGGVLSTNWAGVYLITAELFPTVLRNTALGTGSMVARLGAILAPYIAMTGQLPGLSIALPVTIFGTMTVIASISTYWIPETVLAKMHQTVEEAEAAKDDYGIPCCRKPRTSDEKLQAQGETKEPLLV